MSGEPQHLEDLSVKAALGTVFAPCQAQLDSYTAILASRGIEWGLLGPREGTRLWSRHISNSLALVDLLPVGIKVADVGSGAGLPGIPVAIARPDLHLTLIESLERRVRFLQLVVDELGLTQRVQVVRGRAEQLTSMRFDVVTARAVAPLERLVRWTLPLFSPNGELIALKGESAQREIDEARTLLETAHVSAKLVEISAAQGVEATHAVRVKQINR